MPTGVYIHKPRSEETKRKISMTTKGRKGTPHSEEYKIRMSKERKGICFNTGRTHIQKGQHISVETEFKWKGGRFYNNEGYVLVYQPEHPLAQNRGYILEHRFILEKQIGRYLYKEEVSHHINGVKDDNRPENLMLFSNASKHLKFHKDDSSVKPEEIIFDGRN